MENRPESPAGTKAGTKTKRVLYGVLFAATLGSGALTASIANSPDKELYFSRETHSPAPVSLLSGALQDTALWPNWFFALENVKAYPPAPSGTKTPVDTRTVAGQKYQLFFNNRKSPWSHQEMIVEVLEVSPTRLVMRVLEDSKGKLTRLFDRLDWEIELAPESPNTPGTLIRGKAVAHTKHWKSRVFGTLTEKVLMNQAYYMDLIHLSRLTSLDKSGKHLPSALSSSDALLSLPAGLEAKPAGEPAQK